jgi:hypothetical protein
MARRTAGVVNATRNHRLEASRTLRLMHELRCPDLNVKRK